MATIGLVPAKRAPASSPNFSTTFVSFKRWKTSSIARVTNPSCNSKRMFFPSSSKLFTTETPGVKGFTAVVAPLDVVLFFPSDLRNFENTQPSFSSFGTLTRHHFPSSPNFCTTVPSGNCSNSFVLLLGPLRKARYGASVSLFVLKTSYCSSAFILCRLVVWAANISTCAGS